MPSGLIGAVLAIGLFCPDFEMASDSDLLAWLVTMKLTGPAPTALGDTETLESLTYTLRLIGVAGRAAVATFRWRRRRR